MKKVVFLTGACGLLGEYFARHFVRDGYRLVISDVNREKGQRLAQELGENSIFVETDINDISSVNSALEKTLAQWGQIDILINNAFPRNKNYGKDFLQVTYEDFCENLTMNLAGLFLTSQTFAKHFLKQGHGHIINMGSIYGVVPPKFQIYEGTKMTSAVEYAAIKPAVIHLTKYMAKYFKGKNIRVNCVSPGGISDHQDPVFLEKYRQQCLNKGMLDPKDIYGAVRFLTSEESKMINGHNIVVDDGFIL